MNWMSPLISPALAQSGSVFMPPQATNIAAQYDSLYSFIVWASLISCIILIGGMMYFVTKYKRKSPNDKTAYITHNAFLEFLWSFIPLVIFLIVFAWGWNVYNQMRAFPKNALEIHVVGKQWAWDFQYKSGKSSSNELVVPVGEPVKLIMSSTDVIHSFYIPSMRIKQDVVPGRYTAMWFNAEKLGEYHVFCTEYCGAAHSNMLAKLKVVSREDYDKWLQETDLGLSMVEKGQKYFNDKGCAACHSTDGSPKVGPTWKGIFASMKALADGSSVKVDENYLRESILSPNAKVVKGFPVGVMPSFQGQMNEEQVNAVIEFIKGLK